MFLSRPALRFVTDTLLLVVPLLLASKVACQNQYTHDDSFTPGSVLRISKIDAPIACAQRESVVVNGTTPGPVVSLTAGQPNWIRVYNDMSDDNATIHWHGLSQSVAPFSDGTPIASQWPIPPNHYFDYEVAPTLNESGSYFYHSHVGFQTVSATGPLLVEEPDGKPPYQYDEERIFFLTELYNKSDDAITDGLTAAPFSWSGEPESILVNGQSIPAPFTTDPSLCAPEVFEVEPSKTYRFRFIGGLALADISLAIDGHDNLTIVGADGSYTKPASTDHMQVDSGQRFEVLLTTKSADELNGTTDYWIQLETRYRPSITTDYALLRYKTDGSPGCADTRCYAPGTARTTVPDVGHLLPNLSHLLPPDSDNVTNTWLEYTLTPLLGSDFPSADEVTRRVYLTNVQLQFGGALGQILWDIDNHTWVTAPNDTLYNTSPGDVPYLVNIYTQGQTAVPSVQGADSYFAAQQASGNDSLPTGWDPEFNAFPADVGEVLEIILINDAGYSGTYDVHPWHAHGGHYYDIGSGPGTYDPGANNAYLDQLKQKNGFTPALRDSTMLYRWPANNKVNDTLYHMSGWRGWRIRVQDAGVWMIHCHTLQHMIMGMQTVWVMGNASQITGKGLPESQTILNFGGSVSENSTGFGIDGYLQYGGAAYGNSSHAPVVNHFFSS